MLPYNNQQLTTPFEHGVAYLLRVAEPDDIGFIRQLCHATGYKQLTQKDQIEFCFLLGDYGYFDDDHSVYTLGELLDSIRAMLSQEGEQ